MVAKLIARVDGLPLHLLRAERVWPVPTGLGAGVEPKVTSGPSAALEPMLLIDEPVEHLSDAPTGS